MLVAVNNHTLPIYKKNRIASLLCIFETTICALCFRQDRYSPVKSSIYNMPQTTPGMFVLKRELGGKNQADVRRVFKCPSW